MSRTILAALLAATLASAQNLGDYYVNGQTGQDIATNGSSPSTPWRTIEYALAHIPRPPGEIYWRTLYIEGGQEYGPATNGEPLPIVPRYNVWLVGRTAGFNSLPLIQVQGGGTGMAFPGSVTFEKDSMRVLGLAFTNGDYGITMGANSQLLHRPRIEGCKFSSHNAAAIRVRDSSDLYFDARFFQNEFVNCRRGIELVAGPANTRLDPQIGENVFRDLLGEAIWTDDQSPGNSQVKGLYWANRFERCAYGIRMRGMSQASTTLTITNNSFVDIVQTGLAFELVKPGLSPLSVSACSFLRCGKAIELAGTTSQTIHAAFSGNIVKRCGTAFSFQLAGTDYTTITTRFNLADQCEKGWVVVVPPGELTFNFTSEGDRALGGGTGMYYDTNSTYGSSSVYSAMLCGQTAFGLRSIGAGQLTLRAVTFADDAIGLSLGVTSNYVDHLIFTGNTTDLAVPVGQPILYSCFHKISWPGAGNLNLTDPKLVRPFYKLAPDSPVIDRGNLTTGLSAYDYEGDPRVAIGKVGAPYALPDMGADEFVLSGSVRKYGLRGLGVNGFAPQITSSVPNAFLGGSLTVDLTGAVTNVGSSQPGTAAVLAIGMRDDEDGLPYELAVIGMPGSFCMNELLISVGPFGISPAGKTALTLPIANDTSLVGKVLTFQWWVAASGQNLLGVVASDGLRVTIGR